MSSKSLSKARNVIQWTCMVVYEASQVVPWAISIAATLVRRTDSKIILISERSS